MSVTLQEETAPERSNDSRGDEVWTVIAADATIASYVLGPGSPQTKHTTFSWELRWVPAYCRFGMRQTVRGQITYYLSVRRLLDCLGRMRET